MENSGAKRYLDGDEIDLRVLGEVIWSRKSVIIKISFFFVIVGVILAFTSPKEYETSCTLIPEAMSGQGKLGGSLGGLASLAGVDIGGLNSGTGSTINPGLYRSVAQSTPFLLEIMNQSFFFKELNREMTISEYYSEHLETDLFSWLFGLPGKLIAVLKPKTAEDTTIHNTANNLVTLSKSEQSVVNDLKERILVTMDWDLNIVTIEVEMQDPLVAAEMASFTQEYITRYVTNYSISKSKEQLDFVNLQFEERKKEFIQAQLALATFRDQNKNVNTARANTEQERLQSEYNLAFSLYDQLAKQRESIKMQVNKNTPIFTILEPVKVPVYKSAPKRKLMIFIFAFLGVIAAIAYVLIQNFLLTNELKK
ncbi:Wzz/FepE/Etk N-terminal domain-containing protein [Marinoscillum sp.]|uniref:Wzz/FepE/Etk N-terminal domain-containing protein n=1 Tax=Marinoscillum sp. TaxID=2024838 RepID=UPI003BAC64D1